jgi:hypothetical protein
MLIVMVLNPVRITGGSDVDTTDISIADHTEVLIRFRLGAGEEGNAGRTPDPERGRR